MTAKINCSKTDYFARLRDQYRFSQEGHGASIRLVPDAKWNAMVACLNDTPFLVKTGVIPNGDSLKTTDGQKYAAVTWLMAQRAHTRGKVALGYLLSKRLPKTKKERGVPRPTYTTLMYQEALAEQGQILSALRNLYPAYFEGMLVEPEVETHEQQLTREIKRAVAETLAGLEAAAAAE